MPFATPMQVSVAIVGIDRITGPLRVAAARISGFQRAIKPVSTALQRLSLPILAIGAAAVKVNLDFDRSLQRTFAITGATIDDQKKLRAVALDLANVLPVGPREAAKAMEILAEKGNVVREVFALTKPAVELGISGKGLGAEAGAIAIDKVMGGFRLGAEESSRAADVLARSAVFAGKDIDVFADELEQVAGMALLAGQGLEQTAFDLATLEQLGIKMAPMAMKTALADLAKAGIVDPVTKKVLSLSAAAEKLSHNTVTAGELLKGFSVRGGPAMAALIEQGAKGLGELNAKFAATPGLAAQAAAATSGLSGVFLQLNKATGQAEIVLGDAGLTGIVKSLGEKLTAAVRWFSALPEPVRKATLVFGGLTVALGALGVVVGLLSLPVIVIGSAILAVAGAWYFVYENWDAALSKIKTALKVFSGFWQIIWEGMVLDFEKAWEVISSPFRSAAVVPVGAVEVGGGAGAAFSKQPGVNLTPEFIRAGGASASRETQSRAKVEVEFKNAPNGMRVRTSGDADIETDLGVRVPGSNP